MVKRIVCPNFTMSGSMTDFSRMMFLPSPHRRFSTSYKATICSAAPLLVHVSHCVTACCIIAFFFLDKVGGEVYSKNFEESAHNIEHFIVQYEDLIEKRKQLIDELNQGAVFYRAQYHEAKIVVNVS